MISTPFKKNIKKYNIKTYDDVINSKQLIIDWDDDFKQMDKDFQKGFLYPKFYEHHEIKRMDSRAEYFLNKIFKAFHNHPKQLPEYTHNLFLDSVRSHLSEHIKSEEQLDEEFLTELRNFLDTDKLKCSDNCEYIPKSKYPNENQIKKSFCPLMQFNKPACEGIQVIINHIAGMTDKYAHLEYSRLYFPPEISRM